ncbi:histidine phosphatase family protein [Arthrobacter livingstonensis]|uniref:Histidine phosphatase family protein n=1 Tax=Arthrobacter livingstonensis TaxID=670078 RepID=A0A2V5LFM4_9MICC|nr:histidine phosphatase family protein [Arthrobacter livingstonensis]PYI65150.1 histidine phosphatase family protein [Arthrobacter livingstonensis]
MTETTGDTGHVYLVRHGKTGLNAGHYIRGHANPALDQAGLVEAHALATVLATKRLVQVISSPLDRAADTARIIAETSRVPHSTDDRFTDRDYGPWTGYSEFTVAGRWGSPGQAPGVEGTESVLARARPALDAVLDTAPGGPVAVVTHNAVIRALLADLAPGRFRPNDPVTF